MAQIVFDSKTLQIVCISDTHNDDCTEHIPPGDILIHAGDFTDDGTDDELQRAFDWISALPHRVKVIVAGNHDVGLDPLHPKFSMKALELFTTSKARECGVHYIDREIKTVAYCRSNDGDLVPIRIYGNPTQPDFLNSSYAFTYKPYPSDEAARAWTTAPEASQRLDIWVSHSPPKGRLDAIDLPGLVGCEILERAIAKARPPLCVFGHYHSSWGIEKVRWQQGRNEVGGVDDLHKAEGQTEFDFSGGGPLDPITPGEETIFVNAAWMTMQKTAVEKRNPPFVIKLAS